MNPKTISRLKPFQYFRIKFYHHFKLKARQIYIKKSTKTKGKQQINSVPRETFTPQKTGI